MAHTFCNTVALALVEGRAFLRFFGLIGGFGLALSGGGIAKYLFLRLSAFINQSRSLGQILIGHHLIHDEHEEDEGADADDADGERERAAGRGKMAATGTTPSPRREWLQTTAAPLAVGLLHTRGWDLYHNSPPIYHRLRGAADSGSGTLVKSGDRKVFQLPTKKPGNVPSVPGFPGHWL